MTKCWQPSKTSTTNQMNYNQVFWNTRGRRARLRFDSMWKHWTPKLLLFTIVSGVHHSERLKSAHTSMCRAPMCCSPVQLLLETLWFWKYSLSHHQRRRWNISSYFLYSVKFISSSVVSEWMVFLLKQMSAWLEHNAKNSGDLHSWKCIRYEQHSRAIHLEAGMKTYSLFSAAWNIRNKTMHKKKLIATNVFRFSLHFRGNKNQRNAEVNVTQETAFSFELIV